MAVSKSWFEAVEKMRGIGAQLPSKQALTSACFSRLARHIGRIGWEDVTPGDGRIEATPENLAMCSLHLRSLHTMVCNLPCLEEHSGLSLLFPPLLTSLNVSINTFQINSAKDIVTISQMPLLSNLAIRVYGEGELDLSSLARCPLLTSCMLTTWETIGDFAGTAANIEQLRQLPHITDLMDTTFSDREWGASAAIAQSDETATTDITNEADTGTHCIGGCVSTGAHASRHSARPRVGYHPRRCKFTLTHPLEFKCPAAIPNTDCLAGRNARHCFSSAHRAFSKGPHICPYDAPSCMHTKPARTLHRQRSSSGVARVSIGNQIAGTHARLSSHGTV